MQTITSSNGLHTVANKSKQQRAAATSNQQPAAATSKQLQTIANKPAAYQQQPAAAAAIVDNIPASKRADIISIVQRLYFNGSKQTPPAADDAAIVAYLATENQFKAFLLARLYEVYTTGTPEQFSRELHDFAGFIYWHTLAYQGPPIGSTYELATYD